MYTLATKKLVPVLTFRPPTKLATEDKAVAKIEILEKDGYRDNKKHHEKES